MAAACDRKRVDRTAKDFNACDEFAHHMLQALIIAALLAFLKLPNDTALEFNGDVPILEDSGNHDPFISTIEDLEKVARAFVEAHFLNLEQSSPKSDKDEVLAAAQGLMGELFNYVEFRDAVRYEDPERIFRMWKILIPFFIGAGNKNYAAESIRLFINLKARWSQFDAYVAFHNSTVNISGVEGKGKAIDLLQEHINALIKVPLKNSGSNYSEEHGKTLSLVVLYLMECAKNLEEQTNATYNSLGHSDPKAGNDIRAMIQKLVAQDVFNFSGQDRESAWKAESYMTKGYKKMEDRWMDKFLEKEVVIEEGEGEPGEESESENEDENGEEDEEDEEENKEDGIEDRIEMLW